MNASRAKIMRGAMHVRQIFALAWTAAFTAGCIYTAVIERDQVVLHLALWRWLLLLALTPCVWYGPYLVVLLLAMVIATHKPLGGTLTAYVFGGVRAHLMRLVRSVGGQVAVWAVAYWNQDRGPSLLLNVWTCVSLFCAAGLLKSLAARALSRHFHSASYLKRMQEAVKKELILSTLSTRSLASAANASRASGLAGADATATTFQDVLARLKDTLTPQQKAEQAATATAAVETEVPQPGSSSGRAQGASDPSAASGDALAAATPTTTGKGGRQSEVSGRGTRPLASATDAETASGNVCVNGEQLMRAGSSSHQLTHRSTQHIEIPVHTGPPSRTGSLSVQHQLPAAASGRGWQVQRSASSGREAGPAREEGDPQTSFWQRMQRSWHLAQQLHSPDGALDVTQPPTTSPHQAIESQPLLSPGGLSSSPQAGAGGWVPVSSHGHQLGAMHGGQHANGAPEAATGAAAGLSQYQDMPLSRLEQHIMGSRLLMPLAEQLGMEAGGEEVAEGSPEETQRLALWLLWNITGRDINRSHFTKDDLAVFLQGEQQVEDVFSLLDLDRDGLVTLDNMVSCISAVHQERRKLAMTLQDTKSVVGKLELICATVLYIITAIICLSIFEVSIRELWLTVSSALLAFAFVFGPSLRSVYESVVFLFVVHPFDVGDTLQLTSGDIVKVEEIALNFVTLVRVDGRRVWYPNPKLITEACVNLSRSDPLFDSVVIMVDVGVPPSLMEVLKDAICKFAGEHPSEYTGAAAVFVRSVEAQNKLAVVARWEYTHTGEEVPYTNRWRGHMLMALAAALAAQGVTYTMPPQVVYQVEHELGKTPAASRLPPSAW